LHLAVRNFDASDERPAIYGVSSLSCLASAKSTFPRAAGVYRSLGWGNAQDIGSADIRLTKHRNRSVA